MRERESERNTNKCCNFIWFRTEVDLIFATIWFHFVFFSILTARKANQCQTAIQSEHNNAV